MNNTLPLRRAQPALALAATAFLLGFGAGPAAAQQAAKPPKVQLWMDVSTGGMAGMPELDAMAGGAGMAARMMGRSVPGMGGALQSYGSARGMGISPARVVDIALWNSLKPGTDAEQAIPAGMKMGERLPLVALKPAVPVKEYDSTEVPEQYRQERPKGRILIYWGCGEAVRQGQPRVIDLSKAGAADFGAMWSGRYAADRGAKVQPGYAVYPNERNTVNLQKDSSLAGEHKVIGESIPDSMKFVLAQAQDLMPQIGLSSQGRLQDSVQLSWPAVPLARGYFLQSMGQAGDDTVIWSSSELQDSGSSLFDYLPNATIDRWVKDKVLLAPTTTQCAVPKGIYAAPGGGEGRPAMLRMIAYGSESNFAYPPRPADPKVTWEPEWAVRVRVKSQTMAMLGQEMPRGRDAAASAPPAPAYMPPTVTGAPVQDAAAAPQQPQGGPAGVLQNITEGANAVNALRGLFGR